jgi:chromosome segregation protein
MHLEKIVVHGFKSFADKTEIQILPGITAIVGPNGCGKSNIADGVRWALGEQSPKSLRGHKMEDVIFTGSASRKPLGMAEVSLLFSNDGTLPVPWSEIQVSRRLYRTGESEYLLNKTACRLRDIMDLFIGTGVNPKAYALMEQERLNQILTAKPLDRRIFIEEAAGISRYKQQRAETLGKLEAARQNLFRVRDVMNEIKRQLGSLERQARKARQYKALAQEKQSLALALLVATYAALTAEEAALQQEMERFREAEGGLQVRLSSLGAQQATQRAQIQETEHRLSDLRQSVQKIQGEVERLLERREQLGLQIRELMEEDQRLGEEIRLIGERRHALSEERRQKDLILEDSSEAHRVRGESVRSSEEALARLRGLLQTERERLEALRLDQVRAAGARVELTRSMGELRERKSQIGRRRERLTQEHALAEEESIRVLGQRDQFAAQRALALQELRALDDRRASLEAALADREAVRLDVQSRLSELRLAQAARRSSLEALERLEREREGYGAGVRAVFSEEGRPCLRGVVGTVADLLEVPSGLESAVEAALGERLTWVIVERFEDGKTALRYLNECGAGTATFLPLETLPPNEIGAVKGGKPEAGREIEDDGLRWLGRLVGCPHPALLQHLLGQVAVVPDLSLAESLWRLNGVVATYVTPSGEVLTPTGRLTGGRAGEATDHSLLRRKTAIRALGDEIGRIDRDVIECRGQLDRIETELSALRSQRSGLQQSIQSQEALRLAGEKDLEQAGREAERLSRYMLVLETEDRELDAEAGEVRFQIHALEGDLAATDQAEAAFESSIADLRRSIESLGERESALVTELTNAQIEWAALAERVDALRRELGHIEELERDLAHRLAQSAERRQGLGDRQVALADERLRTDQRAQEVAAARDRLEGEEAAISRHYQELLADRERIESAIRQSERELDRVLEERHAVEIKATEGRVRRQELEHEALRGFGIESSQLLGLYDPSRDLEAARARLNEVEGKLQAMGAVNLVADEEYRELEERLGFLQAQHDDLVGSIKDLEAALKGMTHTAQARFREAFEAINRHFSEIFTRLFEGGRAELRLVEAEEGGDPLEAGVDLVAQPRGKRLQSVTLLSGGEKALTGLALLFAIFYFRPSPFCVLDEVDASLDDANIHRFTRVLRELCQQTQFIVITHNRKTMEAADVLYGITMEEPGLSRLVSVKLAP